MIIRYDFEEDTTSSAPQLIYFIKDQCFHAYHEKSFTHNIAELYLILDGNGSMRINKAVYPLKKNCFMCINPYVSHGEFLKKEQSFSYYILGIANLKLPTDGKPSPDEPLYLSADEPLISLLHTIFDELSHKRHRHKEVVDFYFKILMIALERTYNINIAYVSPAFNTPIVKIKDYIDVNCFGDLSSKTVAQVFKMKVNTLEIKFKKAYGTSIQQYILQKRIEDAKTKLKNDVSSITDIALHTGFESPSYFSKYFKKITGMTPSEYRKQSNRKNIPQDISQNKSM